MAPVWIVVLDADGKVMESTLLGGFDEPAALTAEEESDLGAVMGAVSLPVASEIRSAAHAVRSGAFPVHRTEVELPNDPGRRHIGIDALRLGAEGLVVVRLSDLSVLRREHAQLRLRDALDAVTGEATSMDEAGNQIAAVIGAELEAGVALLWERYPLVGRMVCAGAWRRDESIPDDLLRAVRELGFGLGDGMIGEAWENAGPAWLSDIPDPAPCALTSLAKRAGLRSALVLPVELRDQVIGAVTLFDREAAGLASARLDRGAEAARAIAWFVEASRAHHRSIELLERGPDPVVAVTLDGRIVFVNRRAEVLFNTRREELIGKTVERLVPEHERAALLDHRLKRQRRHDLGEPGEWPIHHGARADGSEFPVEVTLSPMELSSEPVVLAAIRDLTKRALLEHQLQQAHRLESIGQLAAGIAHEINTPCQYVTDNLEFLKGTFGDLIAVARDAIALGEPGADPGALAEAKRRFEAAAGRCNLEFVAAEAPPAIAQALDGMHRVSEIVRSMKMLAHPGNDEMTLVDLNHQIQGAITVTRNEWKYSSEVVTDFDPELHAVPCLSGEIGQVFLNLLVNAAHAIKSRVGQQGGRGLIRVTTKLDGEWAEVRVADDGTGIPAAIQRRIFDPFFTTKPVGQGTGQGLAIAYRVVVEHHRGSLRFETEEGRGTTFIVRLPMHAADAPAPDAAEEKAA